MTCLNDFRLKLKGKTFVPLMLGGMGVDISTTELALAFCKMGAIGHISDAMVQTVTDRKYKTSFTKERLKKYKYNVNNADKSTSQFNLDDLREAQIMHISKTMEQKEGDGLVFINCMEKLTMNNPKDTLKTRLHAALDAGIDGITLSAGLHLGSFKLMEDHPRFREAILGTIVSSVRALKIFVKKAKALKRLPDYIVVEGPLAGGHLGFGMDWKDFDLKTITKEVIDYLKGENLDDIAVIPAGGIFTGTQATEYMEMGADAVQVSTRFTVSKECGLPDKVKQEYFKAGEDDIIVNQISPTGYPMRMLRNSPSINSGIRPNCESFGYMLDGKGHCSYVEAYNTEIEKHPEAKKIHVKEKTCLCTHMRKFSCWTCGHNTYKLKDTSIKNADGSYQLLDASHIIKDYLFSTNNQITLPA